jgi:hypothetical protein
LLKRISISARAEAYRLAIDTSGAPMQFDADRMIAFARLVLDGPVNDVSWPDVYADVLDEVVSDFFGQLGKKTDAVSNS